MPDTDTADRPVNWRGRFSALMAAVVLQGGAIQSAFAASAVADAGVETFCAAVSSKLASVGLEECRARKLVANGGRSVRDRPLFFKEYPPLPSREPRGRVLLLGGIHGDEYASVSIVFKWMEILDRHHTGLFHWQVIPLLNPDGLFIERPQRTNAQGVDLNRNFPTPDWESEAMNHWQQRNEGDPRRFPGSSPASEPEIQWMTDEIERFRPDAIVSVHAPYGLVDVDGPLPGPSRLGSLALTRLGNHPGSLGRYAGVYKGIPVVTIELASSSRMPPENEIISLWIDLVRWLRTILPRDMADADVPEAVSGESKGDGAAQGDDGSDQPS